jgi:hypothetical protein
MKFEAGKPATVVKILRKNPNDYRSGTVNEPQATLLVKRVMKRWVETEDGRKWDLGGNIYPRQRGHHPYPEKLVPGTTAEIELRARANQAREAIQRHGHDWNASRGLSDAAAIAILEIWDRDIAEKTP